MQQQIKFKIMELTAKKNGPFYIYDTNGIRERCRQFMNIPYNNKIIAYATMANTNSKFLEIIKSEGLSVFVNSIPHLRKCIEMGFTPENIIFTSSAMDRETMKEVNKCDCIINLDSTGQVKTWTEMFPEKKIGLRCNIGSVIKAKKTRAGYFLGKRSRLGLTIENIKSINKENINGLHLYPGTDISDINYFKECYNRIIELSAEIPNLDFIDLGGGFGVKSKGRKDFDIESYSDLIAQLMNGLSNRLNRSIKLILEPGRIIGSESGYFVARIIDIKKRWGHQFIGLNASTVQFPRPLFYPDDSYNPISFMNKHTGSKLKSSIYGCSTYSKDYFVGNLALPELKLGEIIIFKNAGS